MLTRPDPSYAEAYAVTFPALALWIHALAIYFLITWFAGIDMAPSAVGKTIGAAFMIPLMVFFFWHYTYRENGERVVKSFEKLGNKEKCARMGLIMIIETSLLPLIMVGLRVAWIKLTGLR